MVTTADRKRSLLALTWGVMKKMMMMMIILVVQGQCSAQSYPPGSCDHAPNKLLCLPPAYSKFELPFPNGINVVEIGIDISDVLRINDKVS